MGSSARETALRELVRWDGTHEWDAAHFSEAIRAAALDKRDAALATFLAGGVVQNRILLDYRLEKLSKIPLGKLERRVLAALRLGAFQLFFADGIPAHAAVGETVALMRGHDRRSAGYVNAVLRAASRIERPLDVEETDPVRRLSIRWSHPEWMVRELVALRGFEKAEEELISDNTAPAVTLRTNTARITRDALIARLREEDADAAPGALDCSIDMTGSGDISRLPSFREGLFWVQDVSSQLAGEALCVKEGMSVLDLCSAPGGKSFGAAVRGGRVTASDISEAKMKLVADGARRLGFDIETRSGDARDVPPEWVGAFDRVICDVPCSGLGIIRKKPDIRYKTPEDVAELPRLQREILASAAKCVKKGGRLVYSTCTWRKEENDSIVDDFLANNPNFETKSFVFPGGMGDFPDGRASLWSEKGTRDGFFICVLGEKDV